MTGEMDQLSVAVVTPRYPPVSVGGGEKSAELLASTLVERARISGVTVFTFDGASKTNRGGVTIRRLGEVSPTVTELQNLSALFKLRGKLSEFDVVHAYNMELHPLVGYLSARADIPSVATLNSYHFFPSDVTNTTPSGAERLYELVGYPTTGRVLRHYMKRIDLFVALSRAIQSIYRQHGFEDCQFEHVPNMIDPAFGKPARERDPHDTDRPEYELLYVGSLTENKGVAHLVRALAQLSPEYRLRIVGAGQQEATLKADARELGVTSRIEFAGRIPYDRIGEAYARANLFVHPGIWPEPLNRTVLEAMQTGLPVVCTDIGGPPEVIRDTEFLCEPGSPDDLAATITDARAAGDGVGERNRRYVYANHTPDTVIPRLIDLYQELCLSAQTGRHDRDQG